MEGQRDKFKQRMLAAPIIKKVDIVKTEKELPDRPKLEKPLQYQSQNVSVGRMLMEIIQLLKVDAKPMTSQEIFNKTLFDISQSPKLLEALNSNERITRDGDSYQFKPRYKVRTCKQLVDLLKQNRGIFEFDQQVLEEWKSRN
jgi:TFIIE beta subunit core domain